MNAATRAPARELFTAASTQQLVMQMEAALAAVQVRRGTVPASAAHEIARTASVRHVSPEAVEAERSTAGHPMTSLLNVWARVANGDAGQWLHYGATTQDIYDTVQLMQLRRSCALLVEQLRAAEAGMLVLARHHRATPMIGRTVGRHALPITFGLKVASWMGENRRAIERLQAWTARCDTGILSGAVGSYAALGPEAFAIEAELMQELGVGAPLAVDWKGSRDMHAEFGALLSIASQTWRKIAQEVFLLQGDDIRELVDPSPTVGSSTMPHKVNPNHSRTIMMLARLIPGHAAVLHDWMISIHERDQVSSAGTLATLVADCERLFDCAVRLVEDIIVLPDNMLRNIGRTNGLIMAEHAMFVLATYIGKQRAHSVVRRAAQQACDAHTTLLDALNLQPEVCAISPTPDLHALLSPADYIGLAPQVVDRAILNIEACRAAAVQTKS
jgi:adenylosuccinate lyase